MRDTNLGDEPAVVTEFLDEYNVVEKFQTGVGRIHAQALGMKIHSLDHGRGSYEFDVLTWDDGRAVAYYPPEVEFSAVLLFPTGWGYYCCQSPQDTADVADWFEDELSEHLDDDEAIIELVDVETE
ncbi:hypothetical protein [Halorussus lipolyticus]|uniref:hypothetical protein n=1 Tax=Halorussus lipolyticus TaxID=3034024 RepID=UPI0023E80F88|nr:hypothetical protein [Halorussus sp. DT80]